PTASYTGRLEMEAIDESSHTATMQAQGTDKRGQGGAKATIYSRLAPADGRGTRVEVVTDYHITGRLARFGRGGMIEDISEKLLKQFAVALQESLAAGDAPAQAAEAADAAAEAPAAAGASAAGAAEGSAAAGAAAAARWSVQPDNGDARSAPSPPSPESTPSASPASPESTPSASPASPEPAPSASPPSLEPAPPPPPS